MAVGSGLSGTLGIATESTPGVPVAVTRFTEFDSESMSLKKHTVQGVGLRGGALTKRASRRGVTAREAAGAINFDAPTSGLGLYIQHMLGSFSTTPSSLGGGLYQQIHNVGSLQGKAFTTQIVKPDFTGVLTQNAYTYPGCKVTEWEISGQADQQLKVGITIDALDQATPSQAITATTLAALSAAAATTLSATATIAAGSYITVGTGTTAEVFLTGTPTGSGPFAIPISPAAAYGHAAATAVTSATAVTYGSAVALQAASYTAGTDMFFYDQAGSSLIAGGVTTAPGGLLTNTGGVVVANVRSFTLKGTNPLKTDRWGIGSAIKSEQLENDYRDYSLEAEVEYASPYLMQNYAADAGLCMVLKFTNRVGGYLQVYLPIGFQDDGTVPEVGGPDILIPKLQIQALDDGTNGAIQIVYVGPDVAC